MPSDDLCWTPATELARMIRAKDISPVEIVDSFLSRIDRVNPAINAYCTVTADEARAAARRAEEAVTRGDALGPLHGVPYSLKDLTPARGVAPGDGFLCPTGRGASFVGGDRAIGVDRGVDAVDAREKRIDDLHG